MATITIRPNADVLAQWSTEGAGATHAARIANSVDTPDDITLVKHATAGEYDTWGFEDPSFSGYCYKIKVRLRMYASAALNEKAKVRIYDGATQIGSEQETGDFAAAGWEVQELTWSAEGSGTAAAAFRKTATELSDVRVRVEPAATGVEARISEAEAVLYYAPSKARLILDELKAALAGISTANGYLSDMADAYDGPPSLEENLNLPNVSIYCDERSLAPYAFERTESSLHVWLHGFVRAQPDDFDNLEMLAADIEALLHGANWHYEGFTQLSAFRYFFGGVEERIGVLMAEVAIQTHHDTGSP